MIFLATCTALASCYKCLDVLLFTLEIIMIPCRSLIGNFKLGIVLGICSDFGGWCAKVSVTEHVNMQAGLGFSKGLFIHFEIVSLNV
jgi:hypothetical protein